MIKIFIVDGEDAKHRTYLLSAVEEQRVRAKARDWNWAPVEVLVEGLDRFGAILLVPTGRE